MDTNILIHGCGTKVTEKNLIRNFCAEVDVCISDTVYWEFLRNTAIDKFRSRRVDIAKWKDGDLLKEGSILREDAKVAEMYARLFIVLMKLNPKNPMRVLRLLKLNLWISAAAISYKYDHILTTDLNDFPDELFETVGQFSAGDWHMYLLVFKRKNIQKLWLDLFESPSIIVQCDTFFQKKS